MEDSVPYCFWARVKIVGTPILAPQPRRIRHGRLWLQDFLCEWRRKLRRFESKQSDTSESFVRRIQNPGDPDASGCHFAGTASIPLAQNQE